MARPCHWLQLSNYNLQILPFCSISMTRLGPRQFSEDRPNFDTSGPVRPTSLNLVDSGPEADEVGRFPANVSSNSAKPCRPHVGRYLPTLGRVRDSAKSDQLVPPPWPRQARLPPLHRPMTTPSQFVHLDSGSGRPGKERVAAAHNNAISADRRPSSRGQARVPTPTALAWPPRVPGP